MKHLIIALLMTLSCAAHAGLASEDSNIANLKARFTKAKTTVNMEGDGSFEAQFWECVSFSTLKGNYAFGTEYRTLLKGASGIYAFISGHETIGEAEESGPKFIQTNQGMRAIDDRSPIFTRYEVIRQDKKGFVSETSFRYKTNKHDYKMSILNSEPSTTVQGAFAGYYTRCEAYKSLWPKAF